MINPQVFQYIENYILKSGEQLEPPVESDKELSLVDAFIVKRTARTSRIVGMLTFNIKSEISCELPDKDLLKWTPGKKAQLTQNNQSFEWLEKGWIIKEIRFKKDGRTTESMNYRMGYRLFKYQQDQEERANASLVQEFERWKYEAGELLYDSRGFYSDDRHVRMQMLLKTVGVICERDVNGLEKSELFPQAWPMRKRTKFLHFVLAFMQRSKEQPYFDWKEIGAGYFQVIGGSKVFDANQEEFIFQLEDWAECPVSLLGMISSGRIVPLFFSGEITGRFSSYMGGPVHAVTDISISQEQYRTSANTLWLVENRAVLTRMVMEDSFLQKSGSLVACVDGHLRSSHKLFIHQLLENSSIDQVIIWSDYDQDGLYIAGEMYRAVSPYPVSAKWIRHDHRIETSWTEYKNYLSEWIQEHEMEQEQVLGGAGIWTQWVSL